MEDIKHTKPSSYVFKQFVSIDSTHRAMLRDAFEWPVSLPHVYIAHHQTHGIGQQGRPWLSFSGQLYFSLGCYMPKETYHPLCAVYLSAYLMQSLGKIAEHAWVKWPNDWINEKEEKIAGLLVETKQNPKYNARLYVISIGLNIWPCIDRKSILPQTASLINENEADCLSPHLDSSFLIHGIAHRFAQALSHFTEFNAQHQNQTYDLSLWKRRSLHFNRAVSVWDMQEKKEKKGVFLDILPHGGIMLDGHGNIMHASHMKLL